MRVAYEMMQDPDKYGLEECNWCHGYGSSLYEDAPKCTRCEGSGLVLKGTQPEVKHA